jgi:EAL domain-containing protein (putative c-di-GMP-specific phosphodiesterase class I)
MRRDLVAERDRYVGFAFAAADLLLELDKGGIVLSATGAAQSLFGRNQKGLIGLELLQLLSPIDRAVAKRLLKTLEQHTQGARLDPMPIRLQHRSGHNVQVLLGGCKLPTSPDATLITITALPVVGQEGQRDAAKRDEDSGLIDGEEFFSLAAKAARDPAGKTRNLLLLRIDGLSAAASSLSADQARDLMSEVGGAIRAISVGADTATRLQEDQFGLVEDANRSGSRSVAGEIAEIARVAGLPEDALKTDIASVELKSLDLSEAGTARAIAYALKNMSSASGSSLSELQRGLPNAVTTAMTGMASLRQDISAGEISLVFQPIVSLGNREVHHYEALTRFRDGRNTFEAIRFAEEVGLTEELDMAVCRLALRELRRVGGKSSVAVNISGRSVVSDAFRQSLQRLLQPMPNIERRRLMFELTESTVVESVEETSGFLAALKNAGHAICLDDFGAGAAAYAYLRHFDVDIVKVDGPFLKSAMTRDRDRALIRSVCRLCRDLDCSVVGEMIEEERQADAAGRLGIDFGQGWLFGRPVPELPFERAQPAARRQVG